LMLIVAIYTPLSEMKYSSKCLLYYEENIWRSTLKIEAVCSSKMLVLTWR
jgi:hypothetical protein